MSTYVFYFGLKIILLCIKLKKNYNDTVYKCVHGIICLSIVFHDHKITRMICFYYYR